MSEMTDQYAFWNGEAGKAWVTEQQAFDALMQPVLDAVLARAAPKPGQRVLDIGCGTGQSTVQAARAVGPSGHVTGIDVSAPMLALAEERAEGLAQVTFLRADAARQSFGRPFDLAMSRFGVMFFDDSTAAFTNIRKALKPGAHLVFATWGEIAKNPWFTMPAQAAKSVLGAPPPVDPDAPGPFALRDIDKTCAMLAAAGFTGVSGRATDLALTPSGTRAQVAGFAASTGPAARCIAHFNATAEQVDRVQAAIEHALAAYETSSGIRIPAEVNLFEAIA